MPVVPLRAFMPGSRMPMLNLSWNDASTVCVPSECVLIDMRDERMSQFRPHRGSSGKHLVRCTDMCHCPAGVLSVWSDGAVHLKPRERLNFGKEMRSTKSGREAQTLGENLTNLMKMSVQPCATSYYPIVLSFDPGWKLSGRWGYICGPKRHPL